MKEFNLNKIASNSISKNVDGKVAVKTKVPGKAESNEFAKLLKDMGGTPKAKEDAHLLNLIKQNNQSAKVQSVVPDLIAKKGTKTKSGANLINNREDIADKTNLVKGLGQNKKQVADSDDIIQAMNGKAEIVTENVNKKELPVFNGAQTQKQAKKTVNLKGHKASLNNIIEKGSKNSQLGIAQADVSTPEKASRIVAAKVKKANVGQQLGKDFQVQSKVPQVHIVDTPVKKMTNKKKVNPEFLNLKREVGKPQQKIQVAQASSPKINQYIEKSNAFDSQLIKQPQAFGSKNITDMAKPTMMTAQVDQGQSFENVLPMAGLEERVDHSQPKVMTTTKTLDLSNVNMNNSTEIINKISDYIQQHEIQTQKEIDFVVKHKDLGDFMMNVKKAGAQDHVDLKIIAKNAETHNFFMKNENELVKALNNSGVKLADFKVNISTSDSMTSSENKNFDQSNGNSTQHQRHSQRDSQNSDSQRRRELWENYKEQLLSA